MAPELKSNLLSEVAEMGRERSAKADTRELLLKRRSEGCRGYTEIMSVALG